MVCLRRLSVIVLRFPFLPQELLPKILVLDFHQPHLGEVFLDLPARETQCFEELFIVFLYGVPKPHGSHQSHSTFIPAGTPGFSSSWLIFPENGLENGIMTPK